MTTEIDLNAALPRVRRIAPEAFMTVRDDLLLRRVHEDHAFLASCARRRINRPLVAPTHPPLHATIGAERWRSNWVFLPAEHRRHPIAEVQIVFRDHECTVAVLAFALHAISIAPQKIREEIRGAGNDFMLYYE